MKQSDLLSFVLVLVAGCAGSSEPTPSEVAALQRLTASVQTAADHYASGITSATATTVCVAMHDDYDTQVRSYVTQMGQMAGCMDGFMMGHGGHASADIRCAATTMIGDLDRHRAVASGDAAADQAETTRHVAVMNAAASHVLARCNEMMAAMRGEMLHAGPMMAGCMESMPSSNSCEMMRDGGMMGR